jgi:hypothetical protein
VKSTKQVKYPGVDVELTGKDGNAFAIMGTVANALRKAGASQDVLNEFYTEARKGDYDHLLQTVMSWVNVL